MDFEEIAIRLGVVAIMILVAAGLTIALYAACQDKGCEGYYLSHGNIWAKHPWAPDVRAFDYTPEMWQSLVDAGLTLPPKK